MRRLDRHLFHLTFYGVPTEVPQGTGSGAGAAYGTLLDPDEHCPLVKYLYETRVTPSSGKRSDPANSTAIHRSSNRPGSASPNDNTRAANAQRS